MLSTARKRLLGLAMIVLAGVIIVLGVSKPDPLAEKHTYMAEFDDVQGLGAIDRDVRVAGVKVGTIGEVERIGDDARAELILEEDVDVHTDARASMRPHTLFEGSNFVDLAPGSPSAPLMEEGEVIPIGQTDVYVTLDEALRVLRPEIRESLRELTEVGAETLQGEAIEGIQKALKETPKLTRDLAPAAVSLQGSTRSELGGAVQGLSRTVDAVASQEAELIPLARRVNRTAAALTVDGGAPLDAALAELPGMLRELDVTSPVLGELVGKLESFSAELTPTLPELTAAVAETTPVIRKATPVLERATPLIRDTRGVTDGLGAAAPGLIEMFQLLGDPLDRFSDSLHRISEPSALGAPSYRQLVAGAFVAGGGSFAGYQTPAQNPNGSGHVWRLNATVNPAAIAGLTSVLGDLPLPSGGLLETSCEAVAEVSRRAARQLQGSGGCR